MMANGTRYPAWITLRSVLFAGALAISLSACGGDETAATEQLRQWVSDGVEAAEAKKRRKLVSMISPSYADARGYNRDAVENRLRAYFLRMDSIELLSSVEEVKVMGDSAAEVLITVGMAGTHDGFLGFSADAYRFALELEKDGGDWLLISARWGEVGKELR